MSSVEDCQRSVEDCHFSGAAGFAAATKEYMSHSWDDRAIFLAERFAEALEELADVERRRFAGDSLAPLAGLTVTVKACFDAKGWTTSCASNVLLGSPAAEKNSPIVAKVVDAGATIVAQTNMTEFAYGALGNNRNFGTPRTPLDPSQEQVAGGSSSGAAVAVARGYCDLAICSDTSGSARIPAAFCGVVGFKPSRGRYPAEGLKWLSPSFDVPGLITRSAAMCHKIDAELTGLKVAGGAAGSGKKIRLAVPTFFDTVEVDVQIRDAVMNCVRTLSVDVDIRSIPLDSLQHGSRIAAEGQIIAYEAFQQHEVQLAQAPDLYDPRIASRIQLGSQVRKHDYLQSLEKLLKCREQFDREIIDFDAFLLPTVPIMPPRVNELEDQSKYLAINSRSFSMTEFANRFDLPSITLPIGKMPIGLMLTGVRGSDSRLLAIACALAKNSLFDIDQRG